MFRFFAWLGGIGTLPGLLLSTRSAMEGDITQDLIPWWGFPLIAVAILAAVWLLGNVFALIAESFAIGYAIGAVLALIVVWWVPENPFLYFLSLLLVLPIALFTAVGQTKRVRMARDLGWA
jgi:hypothetical protein